ncbi:unnamed protein product, partial [Prorocentrum cordatum]
MGRPQPFSVCQSCGNWAYNFRIIANDCKCAKCASAIGLFKPSLRAALKAKSKAPWTTTVPWAKQTQQADPVELLQMLASIPAFAGSREEANFAAQNLQKKEAALRRAADAVVAADAALVAAKGDMSVASVEAATAKQAHDQAIDALSRSLGKSTAPPPEGYSADGKKIPFAIKETDIDNMDEFDENQQKSLRDLKSQMDQHVKQVEALQETLQNTLKSILEIREAPAKRMRGVDGA